MSKYDFQKHKDYYQPYFGINVNPLPEENKIDNKEGVRLDVKERLESETEQIIV